MKKKLSLVLTLVLCAVLVFAFSAMAMAEDDEAPEVPVVAIDGSFDYYSTCYGYGEEVHTIVLETAKALNPETVAAEDFSISFISRNFCGNLQTTRRAIDSLAVDGTKITFNLRMTGNGTNAAIAPENFMVEIVGEVTATDGTVYNGSNFTAGKQINEDLDKMLEGGTEYTNYRLYVPEDAPEKAPLYIWLHGAGEFGDDNRQQVSCSNLVDWTKPAVQRIFGNKLYVLAIQSKASPHNPEYVKEAIDEVVEQYKIDKNRIYIAGCSMGGMGTNDMIRTYPDFFAAAMPNCPASVIGEEDAAKLVNLPIIYVHAANDTTVRLSNSIQSYNNIKAAGSENIWCNFFAVNPNNPVTGQGYMGHWSWTWIHNNYTTTEDEFLTEGVYVNGENEYPYTSTPLSQIGDGYANIASWLADQTKAATLDGEFKFYSTCYGYGEEVHTVVLEAGAEIDPESVQPEDFSVSFQSVSCGRVRTTRRTVESVEVDGTTITLKLVMTGSGTNTPIGDAFNVELVDYIVGTDGTEYAKSEFANGGQFNEELDKFIEKDMGPVQYRLFVPEKAAETDAPAPLYIWLHGAGEFGAENRTQVSCSNLVDWTKEDVQKYFGDTGLYIMAIQSERSPHNPAQLMDAILDVTNNYNIDMSRIYVAGCSMGGMGTNDIIRTYPEFFAAAMPNCPASVIGPEDAAKLVNMPIIYVHAANDTTVRLSNSIQSYNNIKAAGSQNIWCNFFSVNPNNPVTGQGYMGHWSWTWIHSNYTTTEEEFLKEGVYTNNNVEYPYVSTPLSEIGEGYSCIAEWLSAQKKDNSIYVENVTAQQGEEISIPVSIAGNTGITSITLSFDSEYVDVTGVELGEALEGVGAAAAFEYNPDNGKFIWGADVPATADGVLFYIKATVINPIDDGKYPLAVEVLATTVEDGVKVAATADAGQLIVINPHPKGDVTLNGSVTNADLIMIARYLVDLEQFNEEQMDKADYNDDGEIDNTDLVLIAKAIAAQA